MDGSGTSPPPDAAAPFMEHADDPACIRCGYNLTGLDDRRPCPECGLLVGLSRLEGEELRHNRPGWLRRLSIGAALVATGLLFQPVLLPFGLERYVEAMHVLQVAAMGQMAAAFPPGAPTWALQAVLGAAMVLGPALLMIAGVWLLTSRAGRKIRDERDRLWRSGLRILAVSILTGFCLLLLLVRNFFSAYPGMGLAALVGTLIGIGILVALLMFFLRERARRAPAPLLAADSPVTGLAFAVLVVLAVGVAALRQFTDHVGLPLFLEATLYATLVTSWLWCIYLLVRYALAFRTAGRQAAAVFRGADAAAIPGLAPPHVSAAPAGAPPPQSP